MVEYNGGKSEKRRRWSRRGDETSRARILIVFRRRNGRDDRKSVHFEATSMARSALEESALI